MAPKETEVPRPRKATFEKDSYPKMIIVCMIISMILLVVIFGSIFWDLNSGVRDPPADMTPQERAFFEEFGISTEPQAGRSFAPKPE